MKDPDGNDAGILQCIYARLRALGTKRYEISGLTNTFLLTSGVNLTII